MSAVIMKARGEASRRALCGNIMSASCSNFVLCASVSVGHERHDAKLERIVKLALI